MKPTLQLRQGQSLAMTPQLQQAIKLLQLSTLELQLEIQQTLESNPMLEMLEEGESSEDNLPVISEEDLARLRQTSNEVVDFSAPEQSSAASEEWSDEHIPDELPVDSQWDDVFEVSSGTASHSDEDFDFDSRNTATETLQEHLLWQLNLTPMSDRDRIVALAIIDAVASSGFLS